MKVRNHIALLAGLTLATSAAVAQQSQRQQYQPAPPPTEQQQSASVSEQKLEQFVEAQQEVMAVQQKYATKIQSTQDAEKVQALQGEASGKMVEAVEEAGLEVQEYNRIAQLMHEDPEIRRRIEALLQS